MLENELPIIYLKNYVEYKTKGFYCQSSNGFSFYCHKRLQFQNDSGDQDSVICCRLKNKFLTYKYIIYDTFDWYKASVKATIYVTRRQIQQVVITEII